MIDRRQPEKLLASKQFAASARMSWFLRFTVERALEGKGDELKEYSIAREVRPATSSRIGLAWRLRPNRRGAALKGGPRRIVWTCTASIIRSPSWRRWGLEDLWDRKAILPIEWAEKFAPQLPSERIEIRLEHSGEEGRRLAVLW